jgi:hypothetical protein
MHPWGAAEPPWLNLPCQAFLCSTKGSLAGIAGLLCNLCYVAMQEINDSKRNPAYQRSPAKLLPVLNTKLFRVYLANSRRSLRLSDYRLALELSYPALLFAPHGEKHDVQGDN